MFRSKKPTVSISVARGVMESVFDECDRYDADETGGRLLGIYRLNKGHLDIKVNGILEPGPNAQRTPTFFLQDGDHQERLFRAIEAAHPDVEHLGNWHTHHVNGLQTLSGGDKATYTRIVNHAKHNTDFFYALLVVKRNRGNPRYTVKHFVFRRGEENFYEVPHNEVKLVDMPLLQPSENGECKRTARSGQNDTIETSTTNPPANPERVRDQDFFSDFYPDMKVLLAKDMNAPYWKGSLSLVDGSRADIVALEDPEDKKRAYSIVSSCKNPVLSEILAKYRARKFSSARHAVVNLERDLNRALYQGKRG
jgi:hypothetical protein